MLLSGPTLNGFTGTQVNRRPESRSFADGGTENHNNIEMILV